MPNVFRLLNSIEAKEYVPQHEKSIPVMYKKFTKNENNEEHQWEKWNRFQGQTVQGNYFL